jgi:DNA repair photolyase
MIISASRRTDIPALYPEWFMNRIREGYCLVRNPFNPNQVKRVDLSPHNVDVIVFWTKNPQPMLGCLDELVGRGYRYYFHFTLTAHPKIIEPFIPPELELVHAFKTLSGKIGADKMIWRFDPIILSDITPEQKIIDTFRRLAWELRGSTGRVVISFVHLYRSVIRNLQRVEKESGVRFYDDARSVEQVREIAARLAEIAHAHSIEITSCAEKLDLTDAGVAHGTCIDDRLMKRIFGIDVSDRKDKYQRENCLCVESQDIGAYSTCTHGCVYCYAASNKLETRKNRSSHDPKGPFLITPA